MLQYLNMGEINKQDLVEKIVNLDAKLLKQGYDAEGKLYLLNNTNNNGELINAVLINELIYSLPTRTLKFDMNHYMVNKVNYEGIEVDSEMESILADINKVTQGKLTMSQAELEKLYDMSIAITKDENLTMCALRSCLNNSWRLKTQDTNYDTIEDIVNHMSSVHKTLHDTDWEGVL